MLQHANIRSVICMGSVLFFVLHLANGFVNLWLDNEGMTGVPRSVTRLHVCDLTSSLLLSEPSFPYALDPLLILSFTADHTPIQIYSTSLQATHSCQLKSSSPHCQNSRTSSTSTTNSPRPSSNSIAISEEPCAPHSGRSLAPHRTST